MNQTKKRLSIINLAISITDIETIQLQMLKLKRLRADEKLEDILITLENENYVLAQTLIHTYIETPNKEILERTFQEKKRKTLVVEEELFNDEFENFSSETKQEVKSNVKTLNLEDMLRLEEEGEEEEEKQRVEEQTVNFDALLNVKSSEILSENREIDRIIDSDLNENEELVEHVEEEKDEEAKIDDQIPNYDKVTNKDEEVQQEVQEEELEKKHTVTIKEPIGKNDYIINEEIISNYTNDISLDDFNIADSNEPKEKKVQEVYLEKVDSKNIVYQPILHLYDKYSNMQVRYEPLEKFKNNCKSTDEWIVKISNEAYTEADVEEALEYISELKAKDETKRRSSTAFTSYCLTESKYAKFVLARTLYVGDILKKNPAEAFALMNKLAIEDNFTEALCDLAQFYEHGIGTITDKERAEELYKQATKLGIRRARGHYDRLKKHNKGFLHF